MKRELIQNVKVTPYTSEVAIDRDGFLSAVLGVLVGTPTGSLTGLAVKLTVTECDTKRGSYTPPPISSSPWTRPWTLTAPFPWILMPPAAPW